MAQFAVPDADTATPAGWTNSGFARLDEGAPGDDLLAHLAQGNQGSNFGLDKGLTDITDPAVSTGHVLRARWSKPTGNRTTNGRLELWQGVPGSGTLIATLAIANLPTALQIDTLALSGAEADAITDYAAIQLRVYYTYTGGGSPGTFDVDFIELETPDAAGGAVAVVLVQAVAVSSAIVFPVSVARLIQLVQAVAASSAQPLPVSVARLIQLVQAQAASSAVVLIVSAGVPIAVILVQAVAASSAQALTVTLGNTIQLVQAVAASSAQVLPVVTARVIQLVQAVAASSAQVLPVVVAGVGGAVRLVRRISLSRRRVG